MQVKHEQKHDHDTVARKCLQKYFLCFIHLTFELSLMDPSFITDVVPLA